MTKRASVESSAWAWGPVRTAAGWRVSLAGTVLLGLMPAGIAGVGRQAVAAEGTANACGCYQDSTGSCYCGKKTRCGCPGECEPKGCEEKREKEMRREIDAETKKAQDAGRRYNQSSADRHAPVEAAAGPERDRREKATHMSVAQKKELLRLLDLYAAEHSDHASRTIDQARGELTSAAH